MRISLLGAAFVAGLLSVTALSAYGQQGFPPAGGNIARPAPTAAAPPSGTNVAVIDVAYIFKNHTRFNAQMNEIKKEIEGFEATVREEQKKFKAITEELQVLKAGTPAYRAKEEELARMQSDVQVNIGLKRKKFLEQEALVYFTIYREIEQYLTIFCQRNRIGLVLRFNGDEMKPDDRASVLQGVNRAVVYQDGLNITQMILDELNRVGTASRPGPIVPGTGRPPTQQR